MRILATVVVAVLIAAGAALGGDKPEWRERCGFCGMKIGGISQGKMRVTYADGETRDYCTLQCTATDLQRSKGRRAAAVMAADYTTGTLVDARSAFWVVGGRKAGPMGAGGRFAFAREEDAVAYRNEHGGDLASFDQALLASVPTGDESSETEHRHGHGGHDMSMHMGHGSNLVFNPGFGDDIYHTHPEGMWMFNYKFMHTNMDGLQNGTSKVSVDTVTPMGSSPYGYMMAPTKMSMDMQMLMMMYGLTDRVTLMAMANYMSNTMDMVMNMGMGNKPMTPMRSSGFGDTELRGIFKINDEFNASLGLGIPTGNIHQDFETMGKRYRAPYEMQLGSGTWDLKPALTYSALSDDALWNWGGQASYTYHTGQNSEGYSLGDMVKVTGWGQRALGPFSTWVRLTFSNTGQIRGEDPEIARLQTMTGAPTPDADPTNYGGRRLDGLLGISFAKGPFSVGVEGGIPLYENLNGLQMATDWTLNVGFQAMF